MNYWHTLELVIIIGVIIYQVYYTFNVERNIKSLKSVFSSKLTLRIGFVERIKIGSIDFNSNDIHYEDKIDLNEESLSEIAGDDIVKLSLVDSKGKNEIVVRIKNAINTYLINNFGAVVNFSIIKDIVEREIEVKDEEITQSITLPLYLGIAATMIGIIFGLFSMPELSGEGFSLGVNALIGGVKIAMIGSLSGLVCTSYLSSFSYKRARRIVMKDKNKQLTYLQAKLLPELIKAEDTGVSGLKASLDRFARFATSISNDVLTAANQTSENLLLQKDVIEKVENMEVLKITKWNLNLFERMEDNMESLNNFSIYLTKMEQIAAQLAEFGNRTSDINKVVNAIDKTLSDSRQLTTFLTSHFEKIEGTGEAALKAVGIAESHFEDAINSLNERTDEMIGNLSKGAGIHESKLEDIYKEIEENLKSITTEYLVNFKEAYSDSIPKFNQLDNLELMKDINVSIKDIQQNQMLFNKLDSIEDSIKKRPINKSINIQNADSKTAKSDSEKADPEKDETGKLDETVGIGKVIKKIF